MKTSALPQESPNHEAPSTEGGSAAPPGDANPTAKGAFQFSIPVRWLKEILPDLRAVAPRKATLPILAMAAVQRALGETRITVTDLDMRLSFTLPSGPVPTTELGRKLLEQRSAREDGAICIQLADIVTAAKNADPASDVTLSLNPQPSTLNLSYRFGGNTAVLHPEWLPIVEFPGASIPLESGFGPRYRISDVARDAIISAQSAASDDETRYIVNSVFVDAATSSIVGTDGRHLLAYQTDLPKEFSADSLVIPKQAVRVLSGRLAKQSWALSLAKNSVLISGPNFSLTTKLLEGNFPKWQQVVPAMDDDKQTVIPLSIFSRNEIKALLKRLPPPTKDKLDSVTLDIRAGTAKFSVGDSGFKISVNPKTPNAKVSTCAQRKFWQQIVDLGCTEMRLIDEMSPIVGRRTYGGANLTFVFMPVRRS